MYTLHILVWKVSKVASREALKKKKKKKGREAHLQHKQSFDHNKGGKYLQHAQTFDHKAKFISCPIPTCKPHKPVFYSQYNTENISYV